MKQPTEVPAPLCAEGAPAADSVEASPVMPWGASSLEKAEIVSMILAGGRGSRMQCDTKHKVCFEVDGVPVILRSLQTYEACGIGHHVIVIGAMGEQVLHTVGPRHPNASFVYQAEPRGTGDAARCGARMLQSAGYDGLVFVAMGDRLIMPHVIHRMVAAMRDSRSDVVFLVGSKEHSPSSGRVLLDDHHNVAAIVETSEVALSEVVASLEALPAQQQNGIPAAQIIDCILSRFSSEAKAEKACGDLLAQARKTDFLSAQELAELLHPLRDRTTLELCLNGQVTALPARQAEEMTVDVNLGMYLFRASVLYEALGALKADNAQGEYFLTDCAKFLSQVRYRNGSPRYRLTTVRVDHPDESVAFNTREELEAIESKLHEDEVCMAQRASRVRTSRECIMPAREWHNLFSSRDDTALRQFMNETYGPVPELHRERREAFLQAVDKFISVHGPDRDVLIVRSPGRVNLMGSHIDHRGGNTNVIAINDEVLMVASARDDDLITLRNTREETFAAREFSISRDISVLDWADWLTCVNSPKTLAMVRDGDWSNYVRAAALRLQQRFRQHPLRGADVVTRGSIPIGSGLSSSSAVVVGAAEVIVALNGLPVRPAILVDLCGEGEWFVGTRGGTTDHAAIKFGRRGSIAHVGFFPFGVREFVAFPPGYCVVVCNSGTAAHKGGSARITFNTKILGYVAGEILLKRYWPDAAPRIHHLRDITCEELGIGLDELYEALLHLPMRLSPASLLSDWGPFSSEDEAKLNNILSALPDDLEAVDVRGVTLYGLAEIARARHCLPYLKAQDAEGFGALWYLSHEGDRVVSHDEPLTPMPYSYEATDALMEGLIADVRSGDPERVARAQIHLQPGKYGCSTPRLDLIVDLARRHPGVAGAQLSGAGLGGCAIALVREDCCDSLIETFQQHSLEAKRYYPVEGAGLVRINAEKAP